MNELHKEWQYSYRAWDDHASIVTEDGYCVAVRPKFVDNAVWKKIAQTIIESHNKLLGS